MNGGCSPGMSRCAASCLHYQFVMEYRLVRQAQEDARDGIVGAYGPGSTEWDDYPELITFKKYLIQSRGRNEDHQGK
jgi:hypothetical protein